MSLQKSAPAMRVGPYQIFPKWTHTCKRHPAQEGKDYPHPQKLLSTHSLASKCALPEWHSVNHFAQSCLTHDPFLKQSHVPSVDIDLPYTTSQEDLSFVFHDMYYENRIFTVKNCSIILNFLFFKLGMNSQSQILPPLKNHMVHILERLQVAWFWKNSLEIQWHRW